MVLVVAVGIMRVLWVSVGWTRSGLDWEGHPVLMSLSMVLLWRGCMMGVAVAVIIMCW